MVSTFTSAPSGSFVPGGRTTEPLTIFPVTLMAISYAEFESKASRLALKSKLREDGIRLGQGVVAGVVAERAFVAERLGRVNVAFDDEVGVGQNGFQFGQNVFKARPTHLP